MTHSSTLRGYGQTLSGSPIFLFHFWRQSQAWSKYAWPSSWWLPVLLKLPLWSPVLQWMRWCDRASWCHAWRAGLSNFAGLHVCMVGVGWWGNLVSSGFPRASFLSKCCISLCLSELDKAVEKVNPWLGTGRGGLWGSWNFPTITGKVCLISLCSPRWFRNSCKFSTNWFVAWGLMNELRHVSCHGKQPWRYSDTRSWLWVRADGGLLDHEREAFIFSSWTLSAHFLPRWGLSQQRTQTQSGTTQGARPWLATI